MKIVDFGKLLSSNKKPLIMGIVNVTPDSFFDGGKYFNKKLAVEHAIEMAENGADIIDIGGESSRPGAEPVSDEEELSRVLPVIEKVASKISVTISIDTCKSVVAKRALNAGAEIVNDISAMRLDESMADIIKEANSYVVLMHMLGNPRTMQKAPYYKNVVEDIISFLKSRVQFAIDHGIQKNRIIIDPGIGFGKTLEHNLTILRNLDSLNELGYPVLIGASNKSMIGKITGAEGKERIWGTSAIVAHCVIKGVKIHRVHDVKAMRQVCDVASAIKG